MKKLLSAIATASLCAALSVPAYAFATPSDQSENAGVNPGPTQDGTAPTSTLSTADATTPDADWVGAVGDRFTDTQGITYEVMGEYVGPEGKQGTLYVADAADSLTGAVIPSSYSHGDRFYSVVSIKESAFEGCEDLRSVTLPETISTIGANAFKNCRSLQAVTIPASVTTIRQHAFEGCAALTEITIPETVATVEEFAFSPCTALQRVTIASSESSGNLLNLGQGVFEGCSALQTASLGNRITTVPNRTFNNCAGMTHITIPADVTSIGDEAFHNCESLTNLKFSGNALTSIGEKAFCRCFALTNFLMPNSVTTLGVRAFSGCSHLTSLSLSNNLTEIPDAAFEDSGLVSLVVPASVKRIGLSAFWYSDNLERLTVYYKKQKPEVGSNAFDGCKMNKDDIEYVKVKGIDDQAGEEPGNAAPEATQTPNTTQQAAAKGDRLAKTGDGLGFAALLTASTAGVALAAFATARKRMC